MYTRYGLEELKRKLAKQNSDKAMRSACWEYTCDCHDLVPKLLADLLILHERLEQIEKIVCPTSEVEQWLGKRG